jgi:hypothetical protein
MAHKPVTAYTPDQLQMLLVSDFVARTAAPLPWFVMALTVVAAYKFGGNHENAFQAIKDEAANLSGRDVVEADIRFMNAHVGATR